MSTKLRSHGKSVVVWILLAMLVFGLGGFGVTSFTGGIQSIGTVGKTEISVRDYASALRQEMNAASAQIGRPLNMEEARSIGLDRAVQARLFGAAGLSEQAARLRLSVGDVEVGKQIRAAGGFQAPDGSFDRAAYRETLRRQGFTEAEFEARLRADIARSILQGAVAGGVTGPAPLVSAYTAYLGETRDITFAEVTEASLPTPVGTPDAAALKAHYESHLADFTRPETRQISYVWLTPEMLEDKVTVDEAALRAAYDQRRADYVQPERRALSQLVFPTEAEATAAMAEIAAGKASLADLAKARGLAASDIDLGEVTQDELGGAAGVAVFAATGPGVVGPFETDLGPALFEISAIIAGEETTFEEAQPDLRAELAMERARRMIADMISDLEDRLASGATLEEMDAETEMKLAQIALAPDTADGIAAYESFREAALKVTAEDFPELVNLEDGGVFALRLDGITAAAPIPFAEVREKVAKDWRAAEVQRLKQERGGAVVAAVAAGQGLAAQGLSEKAEPALARGGFVEGAPAGLADTAFATEPGKAAVVAEGDQVFVVTVQAVQAADQTDPELQQFTTTFTARLGQMIGTDLVDFYARAAQTEAGLTLDSTAINAVQAQIQ